MVARPPPLQLAAGVVTAAVVDMAVSLCWRHRRPLKNFSLNSIAGYGGDGGYGGNARARADADGGDGARATGYDGAIVSAEGTGGSGGNATATARGGYGGNGGNGGYGGDDRSW